MGGDSSRHAIHAHLSQTPTPLIIVSCRLLHQHGTESRWMDPPVTFSVRSRFKRITGPQPATRSPLRPLPMFSNCVRPLHAAMQMPTVAKTKGASSLKCATCQPKYTRQSQHGDEMASTQWPTHAHTLTHAHKKSKENGRINGLRAQPIAFSVDIKNDVIVVPKLTRRSTFHLSCRFLRTSKNTPAVRPRDQVVLSA